MTSNQRHHMLYDRLRKVIDPMSLIIYCYVSLVVNLLKFWEIHMNSCLYTENCLEMGIENERRNALTRHQRMSKRERRSLQQTLESYSRNISEIYDKEKIYEPTGQKKCVDQNIVIGEKRSKLRQTKEMSIQTVEETGSKEKVRGEIIRQMDWNHDANNQHEYIGRKKDQNRDMLQKLPVPIEYTGKVEQVRTNNKEENDRRPNKSQEENGRLSDLSSERFCKNSFQAHQIEDMATGYDAFLQTGMIDSDFNPRVEAFNPPGQTGTQKRRLLFMEEDVPLSKKVRQVSIGLDCGKMQFGPKGSKYCEMCIDESIAELFCKFCQMKICRDCENMHRRVWSLMHHKRYEIERCFQ